MGVRKSSGSQLSFNQTLRVGASNGENAVAAIGEGRITTTTLQLYYTQIYTTGAIFGRSERL